MTIINETLQLQINTLTEAGVKPKEIANQLRLNYETVKTNVAKQKLLSTLPPKIKLYKGKIKGRYPLQIKKYISDNPTATLEQIIAAVELPCAISTLHNYLTKMDWPRTRNPVKRCQQSKKACILSRYDPKGARILLTYFVVRRNHGQNSSKR